MGCSVGLESYPGVTPAIDAAVMSYAEYNEIEHAEPYVIEVESGLADAAVAIDVAQPFRQLAE